MRLSRLIAVPMPVFALDVQRPGIPGQPGANVSATVLRHFVPHRQGGQIGTDGIRPDPLSSSLGRRTLHQRNPHRLDAGAMAALGTSAFGFAAVALAAIGGAFIVAGLAALFRRRLLRFTLRTLTGLLLVVLGGLAAAIDIGTTGYRALTREDLATRIQVRPVGPQQFEATFRTVD